MKLKEFLKLQNGNHFDKHLINVGGGSDASVTEIWNRIYYKVEEYLAGESDVKEIKEMIDRVLNDYELRTPEIKEKTKVLMQSMGFKFDDEDPE